MGPNFLFMNSLIFLVLAFFLMNAETSKTWWPYEINPYSKHRKGLKASPSNSLSLETSAAQSSSSSGSEFVLPLNIDFHNMEGCSMLQLRKELLEVRRNSLLDIVIV